ncbi:MAG: ATP-binding protein [Christensenellaceae bacterium]|nr:ATP-binding protein [Christensenellaceae bacterium]
MKIAFLSGKGGTGKTLVAVSLARAARRCLYADCDVEEPNGHLFLEPASPARFEVTVFVPVIDPEKCLGCRVCVRFCRFGALAFVNGKPLLTQPVCHACGGCAHLCPAGAITERPRAIGVLERGFSGEIDGLTGLLTPGEVSGVPIIRELLAGIGANAPLALIDCPPGAACAVMECVREADLCVLVAEPTRYGVHNLQMVDELCGEFHKPRVAVMNKCMEGIDNPSEAYCRERGISIAARIPFDSELGRLSSVGVPAATRLPWAKALFGNLLNRLTKEADRV